jgi:hypothetical protein
VPQCQHTQKSVYVAAHTLSAGLQESFHIGVHALSDGLQREFLCCGTYVKCWNSREFLY